MYVCTCVCVGGEGRGGIGTLVGGWVAGWVRAYVCMYVCMYVYMYVQYVSWMLLPFHKVSKHQNRR